MASVCHDDIFFYRPTRASPASNRFSHVPLCKDGLFEAWVEKRLQRCKLHVYSDWSKHSTNFAYPTTHACTRFPHIALSLSHIAVSEIPSRLEAT